MKYIKYIFYGLVAVLAVSIIGKKDAGTLIQGDEAAHFFGPESAYADTATRLRYQIIIPSNGGDDDGGGN